MTNSNLGRKGFNSCYSSQGITEGRSQSRNLEAGTGQGSEGTLLSALFPKACLATVLYTLGQPSQEWHSPQWAVPLHAN